jgi:hypothetical protein
VDFIPPQRRRAIDLDKDIRRLALDAVDLRPFWDCFLVLEQCKRLTGEWLFVPPNPLLEFSPHTM